MRHGLARSVSLLTAAGAAMAGVTALLAVAFGAPNPVSGIKKDEFQSAAPTAILMDAESESVLFEKNADQLSPPSSLAKLMTAEVVFNEIKQGRLKLDQEFTVTEDAWRRGGAPSHTSSMFAPIHSRVRVQDLLSGMIIQSGNDACIALAQGIAGSEPNFAATMNKRARELGLTKSYFANSTGLPDPSMKATPRELGRLAIHIIRTYPEFYPIYGEREFTWNKIRQQNRNPLLAMSLGADGLKTGYTQDGGYGLVGSAVQNGLRLVVVVNGLKTSKERAEEARKILEWGFRGFEARPLFEEGQVIGDARLFGGAQTSVPLTGTRAISLLVPRNTTERISARVVYQGPIPAPVEKGQRIGLLRVMRGDAVVLEQPLQAAESVGTGGLTRRAFDAASELVIGWFRARFQKS